MTDVTKIAFLPVMSCLYNTDSPVRLVRQVTHKCGLVGPAADILEHGSVSVVFCLDVKHKPQSLVNN